MLEAIRIGIMGRSGTLFDGFDAAFRDGDVWAVTGPPSSGKSRLLGVLHGDGKPDAGDVMLDGVPLYRGTSEALPRFQRVAGIVGETLDTGLHTVGDLFRLALLAVGDIPDSERMSREAALLAMVGLPGASDFVFRTLSLSEQVRAALAIELFRGPHLLLLDAPIARIGKEWTEMLVALFRALAREGRIIIFAERDLPPHFPMRPVTESTRSGPFLLTHLVAGSSGEAVG